MTRQESRRSAATAYPQWFYYPSSSAPPDWVPLFISAVADARNQIDSSSVASLTSDKVLAAMRDGLVRLGFDIESGKTKEGKIRRPVLYGDQGQERVAYEVDGYHLEHGIVLEVEAGRGARGNAVYRDLIRTSLIVGARYLALGVMSQYRHQSAGKQMSVPSYGDAKNALDAIYASGRLGLPFEGILLFGY